MSYSEKWGTEWKTTIGPSKTMLRVSRTKPWTATRNEEVNKNTNHKIRRNSKRTKERKGTGRREL